MGTSCERGMHASLDKKSILHELEEKVTKSEIKRQYECMAQA